MIYLVDIRDISHGVAEIEADSAEQAEALAEELYYSGNVEWQSSELEVDARQKAIKIRCERAMISNKYLKNKEELIYAKLVLLNI